MSHSDRPVEVVNGVAHDYDHARVRELLPDYLDGSLSPPDRDHTEEHLDHCDACRAFRNTLSKLIDEVGQLPPPRLRAEAKQRILEQVELEEASTRS